MNARQARKIWKDISSPKVKRKASTEQKALCKMLSLASRRSSIATAFLRIFLLPRGANGIVASEIFSLASDDDSWLHDTHIGPISIEAAQ